MKVVVITKNHPTLHFGQIVEVKSPINSRVVNVLPEGYKNIYTNLHRISQSEYWPVNRAHEYEAYNDK